MAKISKNRGLKRQGRVNGVTDPGELDSQRGQRQEPCSWLRESHWGMGDRMLPHLFPSPSHLLLVPPTGWTHLEARGRGDWVCVCVSKGHHVMQVTSWAHQQRQGRMASKANEELPVHLLSPSYSQD